MAANHESGGLKRKFGSSTNAIDTVEGVDLSGLTYAVTGTTNGIGTETARVLALKGARVVMFNRNVNASEEVKKNILAEKADAQIEIIECDLASLKSVRKAADEFKRRGFPLHVLVLNAGIFGPEKKVTPDGLESHFGVNHVAHFLLTRELLPILRENAPARIVVVASKLHASAKMPSNASQGELVDFLTPTDAQRGFMQLYSASKFCNVLFAFKLHRMEHSNGIAVHVLHPGLITTNIQHDMRIMGKVLKVVFWPFAKTVPQGAATTVYCAASPDVADIAGKYWENVWDDEKGLKPLTRDEKLQDAFWERSQSIVDQILQRDKI